MEIKINNQIIKLIVANSFQKRLLGLMGKKKIVPMFFPKTRSIHTFFMKKEIDVIMLDKEYNIVYYGKHIPRNKIIIKKEAYHTIELPINFIQDINIGDKITIL